MLTNMIKSSFKTKFLLLLLFLLNFYNLANSTTMILSNCNSDKDKFIKNEYIIDLNNSLMTRNYIYDSKTYKKYHITDLSVKKKNSIERFIYKREDLIFTDKIGYPQFYTQLIFEMNSPIIKLRTVINNEEGISKISLCDKVEIFDQES
jgi:hypothetical protein